MMEDEFGKKRRFMFLAALYLATFALMGDMVLIPALNGLFERFPAATNWVNFILSGPALISVLASLITGRALRYIGKKSWLLVGFCLFSVGGIFGVAAENVRYMSFMRMLVGMGMGIVAPTSMALIAEVFTDEKRRGEMFGMYNAALGVVGAGAGLVAGFLATASWQSVFKVYWAALPVAVAIALFIPATPPEGDTHHGGKAKSGGGVFPLLPVAAMNAALLVFCVVYMVVYYQIAVYVIRNGIGDESMAGIFSALGTAGSTVVSLFFGRIYHRLKRASIIPSYALMALCFVILWCTRDPLSTGLSCTLMGAAFGNGYAYFMMRATVIVPPSQASTSSSIFYAVFSIGMFCSPFTVTLLQWLMGVDTLVGIMPILIAVMVASTVMSVALTLMEKEQLAERREAPAPIPPE